MRPKSMLFEIEIEVCSEPSGGETRRITKRLPPGLAHHLSRSEWNHFCMQVDEALLHQQSWEPDAQAIALKQVLFGNVLVLFISSLILARWVTTSPQHDSSSSCEERDGGCNINVHKRRMLITVIILLSWFVVVAVTAVKCSMHTTAHDSWNQVRRVCFEFSQSKPNLVAQLVPRYSTRTRSTVTGNDSTTYLGGSSTRTNAGGSSTRTRNSELQPTWYIELWITTNVSTQNVNSYSGASASSITICHSPPMRTPPTELGQLVVPNIIYVPSGGEAFMLSLEDAREMPEHTVLYHV